ISDEESLSDRQRELDDRERAVVEREEQLTRQARAQGMDSGGSPHQTLDRPPPLVADSSRRSLALLFVFLIALVLLGYIVLRASNRPTKEPQEEASFDSRRTTALNLEVPRDPEPVPGALATAQTAPEAADHLHQQEQELVLARQRAPILITQATGPAPHSSA